MKSLYREYRPKSFAEVIGQKHITQTLQNQIRTNTVGHAYLFCGTRGTGKTSVAKIFAAELVGAKNTLDIFEIDAASNNSVTDVREIIDAVKYPPIGGKFKVYIIDEVHMFSSSAFNAFLKTLEEPPAHVVFILCTTEPHKLLPTVQSRCLRFDFRSVSVADIEKLLQKIFTKEQITADAAAITMLAQSGCGSFRDALSFAETVIAYCGGKAVTIADVTTVLGSVSNELLTELLKDICTKQPKSIQSSVTKIFNRGINPALLVKNFLETIKAEIFAGQPLGPIFQIFAELELAIKQSTDPRVHFENACLVACGLA